MPPISVQESNLISKAKGGDADQQISSLKKALYLTYYLHHLPII